MTDFRIQNFNVALVTAPGETDRMFVPIPQSIHLLHSRLWFAGNHPSANLVVSDELTQSGEWESRDFEVCVQIQSSEQIVITWDPTRGDQFQRRLVFSIVEYIGAIGGPNEFTVARGVADIQPADLFAEISLSAMGVTVDTAQKLTLNPTGNFFSNSGAEDTSGDLHLRTTICVGVEFDPNFDTALHGFFQAGVAGVSVQTGWEAINWIGSNWRVARADIGEGQGTLGGWTSFRQATLFSFFGQDDPLDWDRAFFEGTRSIQTGIVESPFGGEVTLRFKEDEPLLTKVNIRGGGQNTGQPSDNLTRDNAVCYYCISNVDLFVSQNGKDLLALDANPQEVMKLDGPTRLMTPISKDDGSDVVPSAPSLVTMKLGATNETVSDVQPNLGISDHTMQWDHESGAVREFRTRAQVAGVLFGRWQMIQWGKDEVDAIDTPRSVIDKPELTASIQAP